MGMLRKGGMISESSALPNPIPSSNLQQWLEFYSNHIGATDDFTTTAVGGNGTATHNAATHSMDLSSGTGFVGYGLFRSKNTWTPSNAPMVLNCMINNPVTPTVNRRVLVGFDSDFTQATLGHIAEFIASNSILYARTADGIAATTTQLSGVSNGDILTIVLTLSKAMFYVNGINVIVHTTHLPTTAMYIGCSANATLANADATATISLDSITFNRYVL